MLLNILALAMEFDISIHHGAYTYRFHVERTHVDKIIARRFEQFKLTAGERVVVLQSNRPMLRARGLKRKPIFWKVVSGEVKDEKALEKATKAIEQHLYDLEHPAPPKPAPLSTQPIRYEKKRRDYYRK